MQLQGFEQRVKRAFTQPHLFADVSDLQLRGLLVKEVEDL